MKKVTLSAFAMLILVTTMLAVAPVHAQTKSQLKASIPFNFQIGHKTLPAGDYTIQCVNPDAGKTALLIKSVDGRTSRMVIMTPAQAAQVQEQSRLVFNRYGDQYFLSQVWTGGDSYGLELRKARAERELAKNGAERVTVALITAKR